METKCFDKGKPEMFFCYGEGIINCLVPDPSDVSSRRRSALGHALLNFGYELVDGGKEEIVPAARKVLLTVAEVLYGMDASLDRLVVDLIKVVKNGAIKYGHGNYRYGAQVSRRLNSAYRHYFFYHILRGELFDQESEQYHFLHIAANVLIICSWLHLDNWDELNDLKEYREKSNEN